MKKMILLIIAMAGQGGCAARRVEPPTPALASVVKKSQEARSSVESARSDGKEVRRLHIESMSLVERLDYKATLLLKK